MQFVKFQGGLWAYFPSPNRFRKWYRAVEKAEGLTLRTPEDKKALSSDFWDENVARVNNELVEAYPNLVEPKFSTGMELMFSLQVAVDPNEFFVVGLVDPKTFGYDQLVRTTPSQPRPIAYAAAFYDPHEGAQRRASHDAYVQRWEREWSSF